MKSPKRSWRRAAPLIGVCLLFYPGNVHGQASAATEWTEQDTALANRYLGMLEANPEYSRVLELIWNQYADHGATELLMARFSEAEADASPQVRMVYAHLLRRSGDAKAAQNLYEELLEEPSMHSTSLLGLVDLALGDLSNPVLAEAYLSALTKEGGVAGEVIRASLLSLADLYLARSNGKAALRVWRKLVEKHLDDLGFLQQLARRMINAGYLPEAIEVYEQLREKAPTEARVALLSELGGLYELADDFESAAAALNAGRGATHFKHHTHLGFLSMLVRLHERHGKLDDLEGSLLQENGGGTFSEQRIHTLVRFYDLTARPTEKERWLRELVDGTGGQNEYRSELVEVLLSNDRYREAKRTLERLLADGVAETLALRLLRVRAELSLGGREVGSTLLSDFLKNRDLGDQGCQEILQFAEEHYLDQVVETLLSRQVEDEDEDEEAIFQLVDLHQSRGRVAEAKAVLNNYIAKAEANPSEKAERLYRGAAALQRHRAHDEARNLLKEAVAIQPGKRDYLIRLAEAEAEAQHIDEALEIYEVVWSLCATDQDRIDIDQRIHSLLHLSDLKEGSSPTGIGGLSPGVVRRQQVVPFPSDIGSQIPAVGDWKSLAESRAAVRKGPGASRILIFYSELRGRADSTNDPAAQYRAAWWARLLGDYSGAIQILSDYREANSTNIKVERLLLEVAEASKEDLLALRQLELLARIDSGNAREYELRRAQVRIGQGDEAFREEALEDLEKIASADRADAGLLKQISGVYSGLDRHEGALSVYRRAFDMSTTHEKRGMIGELNRLQVQTGRVEEALDSITDLVQEDNDILQRRKELADQLSVAVQHQLVGKLESDYKSLQRKYPLEPFYSEALALVSENLGKSSEAFVAIKRAYYGTRSKDGYILERMRQLAAKTGDVKAAMYYQKQLVSAPDRQAEASEWHKLIRMLEMDVRVGEADRIRVRLESKFAQDPEVLEELAKYYLEIRQSVAARRVLGRLARLRPWHVNTLLSLGILEKEAGNAAAAADLFFQALENTREFAKNVEKEDRIERYPLRGFSAGARPELSNQKKDLGRIVGVLDDVQPIDDRLRVQLAHYFESGRAEHQTTPADVSVQRLRVIEELGELVSFSPANEVGAKWARLWKEHPPLSLEERFWVTWCGGEKSDAWEILEKNLLSAPSSIDELLLCLYGMHANQVPSLMRWIRGSDVLQGVRHRRVSLLVAATAHYCTDRGTLPPDSQLSALLSEGFVNAQHIYAILGILNREGRYEEAIKLGEWALNNSVKLPAHFEYSLASLAFGNGDTEKQKEHLEAAIAKLDPNGARFQEAAVMLFRLLGPSGLQHERAGHWLTLLERTPDQPRASFGRGRILHLLGDDEGAREAMSEVVVRLLEQAKALDASLMVSYVNDSSLWRQFPGRRYPARYHLTASYVNDSSLWMNFFDYARGARNLGMGEVARESFADALRQFDLVSPQAQQASAQFQNFVFEQIRWSFEGSSFRERNELLDGYRSVFRTDEEWEALAGSLAGEGHHRDAIGIYKRLLEEKPGENDYLRAFLAACATAREFEPALEYLSRLLNREVPPPEGSIVRYLQQQHSIFLSMADDVQRLKLYADQQQAGPMVSPPDRHYHHALADLLQKKGALKDAAAVYESIDDGKHQHAVVLRTHASILAELGEEKEAIGLLERAIPSGGRMPGRLIIGDLAEHYASNGETEKLRRLSLNTLEDQDDDLAISIASSLSKANLHAEAEGILQLAIRRAKNDVTRIHLLGPALEIALRLGEFDRVRTILTTLCDCDITDSVPDLMGILESASRGWFWDYAGAA